MFPLQRENMRLAQKFRRVNEVFFWIKRLLRIWRDKTRLVTSLSSLSYWCPQLCGSFKLYWQKSCFKGNFRGPWNSTVFSSETISFRRYNSIRTGVQLLYLRRLAGSEVMFVCLLLFLREMFESALPSGRVTLIFTSKLLVALVSKPNLMMFDPLPYSFSMRQRNSLDSLPSMICHLALFHHHHYFEPSKIDITCW